MRRCVVGARLGRRLRWKPPVRGSRGSGGSLRDPRRETAGAPREPPGTPRNPPGAAPACQGRPRELQFPQESSLGCKVLTVATVSAVDFLCHLEQDYLDSAEDLGILLNTGIFVSL